MTDAKDKSTLTDLEQLRGEIDSIDQELLRLINQRALVAIAVGKVKRSMDADPTFYRAEREAQILRHMARIIQDRYPTRKQRGFFVR